MTPEEYKSRIKELEVKLGADKKLLAKEYALSNNPYKVGDTVTDHIGSLKVEHIKFTVTYSHNLLPLPQCVYFGIELKKDGTPMKKQSGRGVWQENIVKS